MICRATSSLPGRSASQTRVNALMTRQSIDLRQELLAKGMDARVKPAHDGVNMVRRRDFIFALGAAAAWPLAARAQQPAMPVIGFMNAGSAEASARNAAAFRKGLGETGSVEGQNVTVDYHCLEGQYDRLPALAADLVRRRAAVIGSPG